MAKLPVERRLFAQIKEIRTDEATNKCEIQGYATTYNSSYPMYGGPEKGGWNETIARGASKKSLMEHADVRFLINHEGITLARTASGTLELQDDELGLYVASSLDLESPLVRSLASALRRKDMDQMSFAFRVVREEWDADYTQRTIKEVELLDVSVVSFPANPTTQIGLRDQILAEAEKRSKKVAPESTPNLDKIREIIASVKN